MYTQVCISDVYTVRGELKVGGAAPSLPTDCEVCFHFQTNPPPLPSSSPTSSSVLTDTGTVCVNYYDIAVSQGKCRSNIY
jgi:hypothetical protein